VILSGVQATHVRACHKHDPRVGFPNCAIVMPMTSGPYVLIVEDDRLLREMVRDVLRSEGHETAQAADASAALAYLRLRRDRCLLLLDLHVPRADGLDLLRTLRSEPWLPELNVVVMTAQRMAPDGFPAVPILFKPFTLDALLRIVNRYSFRPPPGIV
jgi:CheY-like chemotaxis protein